MVKTHKQKFKKIKKYTRTNIKKRAGGTKSSEERNKEKEKVAKKTVKKRRKVKLIIVEKFDDKEIEDGLKEIIPHKQEDLKIEEEVKEVELELEEMPVVTELNKPKRLNETFIDLLDKLANIMVKHGEPFRARAYQKAQEAIMTYIPDITSPDQIKNLPGIGPTIMEKLNEYVTTGTLRILEREKNNPINIIGEIYGVGPKKAKELIDAGITSIEQLRGKPELLNDIQRVGLKYYEDILQRIPRAEIDDYKHVFSKEFSTDSHFEIVGSYRRGALDSGDIDVIITSTDPNVFKSFVENLKKTGIILPDGILSFGPSKSLVIAKLPGAPFSRRVDFLYTNPEEYPFAVLYFTGSKIFNTVMRGRALALGYSLNEHGIYKMEGKRKGDKVNTHFTSEKDIFDFLGMEYREPSSRVNGLSVVFTHEKEKEKVVPLTLEKDPDVVLGDDLLKTQKAVTLKKGKKLVLSKNPKYKLKIETKNEAVKEKEKEKEPFSAQVEDSKIEESVLEYISAFRKHGIPVLTALKEDQLISILHDADKTFHLNKTPIMSDNEYDIVKEYAETKYQDNPYFLEVGTNVEKEKNKVVLPYPMPSQDKIKPNTDALELWKKKYPGPYVLSCKLDGVSGMYSTEGATPKLYTRGNGLVGQDISHLIPHLRLPRIKNMVVRGEFIIPKATFKEKYHNKFANPRNLVAGVINRNSVDKEKIGDIHFVAYEVIQPVLKPSAQMERLKEAGFETVLYRVEPNITNDLASEILIDWRTNYLYEMDGVIITDDNVYPRKATGNPDHSFAFKMVLSDQMAEAKVVNVIWTPSKDGYLKPRVQIEPVHLGGVTIEFATGFNGAFIQENKIGVGALIQIIRSGDVIPYIRGVTTPAEDGMMPAVPYKWNATHVDVMLEDISSDATVREKNITGFFRGIEVEGLSSGNIARIIAAGFDTIPAILKMTVGDFLKVEGFKEKMATKIHDGIKEKLGAASLVSLMSGSNLFGRGFSDKKMELILAENPDILVSTDSDENKIAKLAAVKGIAAKTAESIVKNIPVFKEFLIECGLEGKLNTASANLEHLDIVLNHPLNKKSVVLTGTRDKALMAALKTVGANLGSSVSKNTFAVIAATLDEDTGKAEDARRLGVPIFTPATFTAQYNL